MAGSGSSSNSSNQNSENISGGSSINVMMAWRNTGIKRKQAAAASALVAQRNLSKSMK